MHAGTHAQTDTRARQSAKLDERYWIVIFAWWMGRPPTKMFWLVDWRHLTVKQFSHRKHYCKQSHAGTAVPECFKDDNASQWKSGKFDPRSLKNLWTDRHLNLHGWLRRKHLPPCKISSRHNYPFRSQICESAWPPATLTKKVQH